MAAIEVEAIVAGLSERFQSHEVLIDGQRRGTMKGGETRLFEVPPGIHTIRLKVEQHSSPAVKVVVGFGKTSVVCQTTARRRFGLFSSPLPNTQILVREEYAATPIADRIVWRASEERSSSPFAHAMAD
jgi:hypothetical protein